MWLFLAFMSAALLGFYDSFKKKALQGNAVIPVLFLNTVFCSLIFLPLIILSAAGTLPVGSTFHVGEGGWEMHRYIILKSVIVLSSWLAGYIGMKHLPLTIVGPINATRPVMVLVGALLVFGERLNAWQWAGVAVAVTSFFMLSKSGKREGINFSHNKWIGCIVLAAVLGAVSGLYDKYLMASPANGGVGLDRMAVQSVQYLPVDYDVGDASHHLAATTHEGQVSLELDDCGYQYFSLGRRFRLFLCAELAGGNDLYCIHDPSEQCHREFPLWCRLLP